MFSQEGLCAAKPGRTGAGRSGNGTQSQQASGSRLRTCLNRLPGPQARLLPFLRTCLNRPARCHPASRLGRVGPGLPRLSLSATQHRSCQLEFFSKKSFRHPVLACFVLVPAPAAPGPARFSVRGPWFLDTRVFGQTKTPEAQIPPGFPTGYDPVLPGKFEKVMR